MLSSGAAAGGVIALAGEAGIGKSRLAAEALRLLRLNRTLRVVSETCRSYEEMVPYSLFGRVLCQLISMPIDATALQALLDDLVPAWSRFAPLLHPLLGLPPGETPLTAALTAEGRRDRLTDLVRALVPALADRRPLLLLLDDLQWADASSWALIDALTEELPGHPLLLLLVARTLRDPATAPPDLPNSLTLTLLPLSAGDSTALLQTLLDGEVPGELDRLVDHSAGMPFFLEETVRYLLDSGALRRSPDGRWLYLRPVSQEAVPARVEQMITARLDRLDEETRLLAQVAAVFGPQVSTRLLAQVPAAATHLQRGLTRLTDAALLVQDEDGAADEYRFKQGVTRDVTYSTMLFARRRELHAQAATAIEHVYADDLSGQQAVLAEHYQQAGQPAVAFTHFMAAATQAQARYAHTEALRLYPQALAVALWTLDPTLPPDPAQATPLYEGWGDLLALTGDYPAARAQYEALLRLVGGKLSPDQALQAAALHRKLGSTYEHQGDMEQARTHLQIAAAGLAALPITPEVRLEQARVLSDLGWVGFRQGDLDQAQLYLEQALNTVLPLADHPAAAAQQAAILNRLGGVAWSRGDLARAQSYVEQYLHSSEQSGNLADQAKALNNLALLLKHQDRLDDAISYSLQTLAINEQIGNFRMLILGAINVGNMLYYNQDYQSAYSYLKKALDWSIEVHDLYHQHLACLNIGRVCMETGDWEAAAQSLSNALILAKQTQLQAAEVDAYTGLGEVALQRGDLIEALAIYNTANVLTIDKQSEEYGLFQRLAAKIAQAEGNYARADELLAANEILFSELQNRVEVRRTQALRKQIAQTT
ncbi:MAG: tetratricopeptide repeat protein [Chloroflexota bacterium]|nr:tetratricopeptide repeat protein [Chloroflexota bacterium]